MVPREADRAAVERRDDRASIIAVGSDVKGQNHGQ
jgi:hypothetical protein